MPSQYEETTVEELKLEEYSDEQVRDIAENDTRVTAREAAEANLNRRENDTTEDTDEVVDDREVDGEELPAPAVKLEERTLPNGEISLEQPAGEAVDFVRDSTGAKHLTHGLEAGAGQVQHKVDQANASGHFPADGSPPAADHTVAAVTGNTTLQEIADEGGTAPEDAAGFENTGS